MSLPVTVKGQKVALLLGNDADPEVFAVVCGITTKGLTRTNQTSDSTLWDCTDPDAAPVIERDILAGDWSISGSGQAVVAELDRIEAAFEAPANWRIVFYGTGNTVVRSYTGNAIMTSLELGAVNGQRSTISLTLSGNGELLQGA